MLIDTNVYSALNRGHAAAMGALQGQTILHIPIVVVGELRYGFRHGTRQHENDQQLNIFLARDTVEILPITIDTTLLYGDMAAYSRRAGRSLSDNDLWIAATAKEHGLQFVTFDRDFEVFSDLLGDKLTILAH